jgi:tight adherence protein B
MAARINLTPFNFFVSSVLIQRQTGGDLAEILDNISRTIRARIRLQQHLKALTSEGRTTGYVLTALPIVIFFIMYASNPDYAGTLLVTDIGRMLLVGCVVLLILGQWMIKKIMNIQV